MIILSSMESHQLEDKIDLNNLKELIEELYVPELKFGFEKPANVSDYSSYLSSCNEKFERIDSLVTNCINNNVNEKIKQLCITSVIVMCGEHSSSNLWTTDVSIKLSKVVTKNFLNIFGYTNIADVLISDNGLIFDNVLKELRPKLLKDSWKNYPAAVICYSWLLQLVESPHLAEHLNSVLPTSLILVDDFVSENRTLGLKCIQHIIQNVGRTHLSWYAQDEVILKALEPLVFFKEEELIEPLISVLMALLKKKYPQVLNVELIINDFDPIIHIILNNMMLEQRLKIRSGYSKMLPIIIKGRGLGMLLHSIALLKVIDEYVLEPTSSEEGLEALQCFMEVCWPRIFGHFDHFFLLICKIYLGLQHKRYPDVCEKKLQEIINTMQKLCPKNMEEKRKEISKYKSLSTLQDIFK